MASKALAPLAQRSRNAGNCFLAFAVLSVVELNLELVSFGGYLSYPPETPQEEIALVVPDWILYWVTELYRYVFYLCAGVYSSWFYRATQNAALLRAKVSGPVMELGNYVIPLVNLWAPFLTMREIMLRSGSEQTLPAQTLRLLRWWWGCWVAGSVLNNGARFVERAPATAGNGVYLAALYALGCVSLGAAAWFVRDIIHEVTRRQDGSGSAS